MFNRKPKPVEYVGQHREIRAGDIGEDQRTVEMEPLSAPAVPEPVVAPEPILQPEPVPA